MFINIDGLNINYIDSGDKNSENAILLLHGWGSNITLFQKMIDMLSPYMRVVAPDMAGFGESDEPKE
ncbi:MAG: alpha/beta hydrolase, partial [Ruminiclostridium sp.]|nr:alpha/beta hydrolase [Ruminiclostridium sp.]